MAHSVGLFCSKAGLEREQQEFGSAESQSHEGRRKGLWDWSFFCPGHSAGRMSAKNLCIKYFFPGFSLQVRFGLVLPAPHSPQKLQLFPQMSMKSALEAEIAHCTATSTLLPLLSVSSDGKRGNFAMLYGMGRGFCRRQRDGDLAFLAKSQNQPQNPFLWVQTELWGSHGHCLPSQPKKSPNFPQD